MQRKHTFIILSLTLKTLDNCLTDDILKYFSLKTGFAISYKTVPSADNLHEMSNPVSWKNKKISSMFRLLNLSPE